jgi:diguanylate cyclase (GGDEF)-like protein/PAS domain S-box-containing protein
MDHLPDTIMVLVEQGTGIKVVTGAGLQPNRARDSAGRWLKELTDRAGVPIGALLEAAFAGENQTAAHETLVGGREHEVLVCPLPPANGRAQALVLLRDVSRDRRRERAITAAKQRADRLFEDAPQGIALLTPDGRVVRANPALRRLLGRHDLVGLHLSELSFVPHDGTLVRHLAKVASGPGHPVTQWSARGVDGVETHIVLSSSLLTGADGEPDLVLTNLLDVSERYRYEQRLAHLADHDPLTGLANRRRFDADLARHVDECRRYGVRGALLLLDLDHFKQVNDRLGHAVGDELLTVVAGCLSERLRSSDVVARLGGDEFAVLLPHADRKATELVAQSLVDQIRERLTSLGELQGAVTVSVGAVLVEEPGITASELLSAADSAMYAAKAAGRNQYVVRG